MHSVRGGPGSSSRRSGSQATGGQRVSVTSFPAQGPPTSSAPTAMVMPPVSQMDRVPRKNSRTNPPDFSSSKALVHDPELQNPDGTYRTVHRLPNFDQSYAQAMNCRYIRHTKPVDFETELSVAQIFEKKNNN